MIEPSNDERSNLPDATRGYMHDLEQERDALRKALAEARRQVAVLVSMAMFAPCAHCAAKDFCDNQPAATTCEEKIAAWSAQQAKGGGK